jgi:hypothetical protein
MAEPTAEALPRHPDSNWLVEENIRLRRVNDGLLRDLAACRALLQTILDATAMVLAAGKDPSERNDP